MTTQSAVVIYLRDGALEKMNSITCSRRRRFTFDPRKEYQSFCYEWNDGAAITTSREKRAHFTIPGRWISIRKVFDQLERWDDNHQE